MHARADAATPGAGPAANYACSFGATYSDVAAAGRVRQGETSSEEAGASQLTSRPTIYGPGRTRTCVMRIMSGQKGGL